MKAVCCDRCGVFAKVPDLNIHLFPDPILSKEEQAKKDSPWHGFREYQFGMDRDEDVLLCPVCYAGFKGYMASGKEKP